MSSCLNININDKHIPEKKETLWLMMTILIIFTLYYIFVNAKYVKVINKYMPFIGKFVDKYKLDACIKQGGKSSISIIYILLISVYIIIFASIFVYSYLNFGYLFKTLGDGVYVFISMFVFMYVIFDRIYYYDRCFSESSDPKSQCYKPTCPSPLLYSFSDKKCVKKVPPTTTTPSNTTPSEPTNTTKDSKNNNDDDNRGRRGPPGAPGPPGPPGASSTQIYNSQSLLASMVKSYDPMLSTKSDNLKNNLRKGIDKLEDDVKQLEDEFNKLEGFKNGCDDNINDNDIFLKASVLMDELYELIK